MAVWGRGWQWWEGRGRGSKGPILPQEESLSWLWKGFTALTSSSQQGSAPLRTLPTPEMARKVFVAYCLPVGTRRKLFLNFKCP